MKYIEEIVQREDIHRFVFDLWKTDLFKRSHGSFISNPHAENGFVGRVVDQFAYLPRFFGETSNDQLERSHFSTWWGVIMLRDDYDNPYIHDLYLLHEMYHAGTMPYVPGIGKEAFDEKMQRNELEASVMSEILVYFEMPELRALSFPYPIYADRYLDDPRMVALWKSNRVVARETIRAQRRNVMVSKPENEMDTTERWIRRFAEQNAVYSITWGHRYPEIEQRMADFQVAALKDRNAAMKEHRDWIMTEARRDKVDGIPFRQEAVLFAPFYWANKARYSEEMAAAKKQEEEFDLTRDVGLNEGHLDVAEA